MTVREARPEDAGELLAHYRRLVEEPDIPLPGAADERPASLTLAIHLYEKLGFRIEGRRRRAVFQRGAYVDDLVMGLLL